MLELWLTSLRLSGLPSLSPFRLVCPAAAPVQDKPETAEKRKIMKSETSRTTKNAVDYLVQSLGLATVRS
jgi:hypothetical protein